MLRVAGVGPGNIENMTIEVFNEIKKADYVIAFGRIEKSIEDIRKDIKSIVRVSQLQDLIKDDGYTLILASGDPCFYGVAKYLKKSNVKIDKIYPGISSFQYLMSKLQLPWEHANLFSLHGRDYNLNDIKNYELNIGLTDSVNTPSSISQELKKIGVKGSMIAAYNLSYNNELIEEKEIGSEFSDISKLAIVVIKNDMV